MSGKAVEIEINLRNGSADSFFLRNNHGDCRLIAIVMNRLRVISLVGTHMTPQTLPDGTPFDGFRGPVDDDVEIPSGSDFSLCLLVPEDLHLTNQHDDLGLYLRSPSGNSYDKVLLFECMDLGAFYGLHSTLKLGEGGFHLTIPFYTGTDEAREYRVLTHTEYPDLAKAFLISGSDMISTLPLSTGISSPPPLEKEAEQNVAPNP